MNDDNVVVLPVITRLDRPPERVLQEALNEGLMEATIIGYDANGNFFFASSKASGADVIWALEMAKKKLLEIGDAE